jgi:hypothetical protein
MTTKELNELTSKSFKQGVIFTLLTTAGVGIAIVLIYLFFVTSIPTGTL